MQIVQKNITGVNQRILRTESDQLSKIDGLFPFQTGIQNRLFGKNLIKAFPNPVEAIFQYFTPYGYFGGIFQEKTVVVTAPWTDPPFNFPITPTTPITITTPTTIPVTINGSSGFNGGTGLGGGTSGRWVLTASPVNLPAPLSLNYYTGSIFFTQILQQCGGYVSPPPGQAVCRAVNYPPLPSIPPTIPASPPGGLQASSELHAVENLANNLSPPPNYNIQISNTGSNSNTVATYDFTSIISALPQRFQYATLLASGNSYVGGVNTAYNAEIPFPFISPSSILTGPAIITLNALDYLKYSDTVNSYTNGMPPPSTDGSTRAFTDQNLSNVVITQANIHYYQFVVS